MAMIEWFIAIAAIVLFCIVLWITQDINHRLK